jgi:glycosyltransferase involved in cell wall biosynthesis
VKLRPRVMHVTTTDISLELLLGPQLRAFHDAGYEVIGVSAPGPYSASLEAVGIRHVPLRHATRAIAPWHDLAAFEELRRLFARTRPDIVHTHNPKPGIYGRLAARAAQVPLIVNTVHGLYAQPSDSWARRAAVYGLERLAASCSHAELIQNVEDVRILQRLGVDSRKLHVLGNGIDLCRFDPARVGRDARARLRRSWGVRDDEIVCGLVGRLVWEKGYREVFEAARELRKRAPRVRFVIVGPSDGAKRNALRPVDIERAGDLGNVAFVGERRRIEDCYAAFDLYVLGSYREGFPRSAMEAAAMGLPIVATDIRGCRQVVDDGQTGLLVKVRDARALAQAIGRLARDAAERTRMSQAARAKAEAEFDQQRCIDLTLSVYASGLGAARAQVAA